MHSLGSKTERFSEEIGREQLEFWQVIEENKRLRDQCKRLESEQAASRSEINLLREQIDHFNTRWDAREGLIEELQNTIVGLQEHLDDSIKDQLKGNFTFSPSWTRRPDDGRERSRELALKEDRAGSLIKSSLSYRRTLAQRAR